MPKLSRLATELAEIFRIDEKAVTGYFRYLRPTGFLPRAKPGRGSDADPDVTPNHATALLLAMLGVEPGGARNSAQALSHLYPMHLVEHRRSGPGQTGRIDVLVSPAPGHLPDALSLLITPASYADGMVWPLSIEMWASLRDGLRAEVTVQLTDRDGTDYIDVWNYRGVLPQSPNPNQMVVEGKNVWVSGDALARLASLFLPAKADATAPVEG